MRYKKQNKKQKEEDKKMEKKKIKEGRNYKMKQKERKKLNNKGITLIALVITIVLNCYRSGRKLEYAM